MMKYTITLLIIALSVAIFSSAQARPLDADLVIRSVEIDHDFTGINIVMFGARNDVGNIIVVLRGEKKNYIIRKKDKIAGIWVNSESATLNDVDSFYTIAGTIKSLDEIKNDNLLKNLAIGVDNIKMNEQNSDEFIDIEDFKSALRAKKLDEGLYSGELSKISFWGETLFRTTLKFPKNIEKGMYTAEVYLFHDGMLSAVQSTPIKVQKIGFEAFMFDFAHGYALLYGLLCVIMAVCAGWVASAIFGRM